MGRYDRQELVIGKENQDILNNSTVTIVGIGALGTVAAELLARAGVNLILIDRDVVEETNLQRQMLFAEIDIGKSKAITAKKKLEQINSKIKIVAHSIHLSKENIELLNSDLVLDCCDNLKTRFLINWYCKNIPWIYSAAIKSSGYIMPILPGKPCLQCFLREGNLDTCDSVGVLNTITTSIAAMQVNLAIKILLKKEIEPILYHFNIWDNEITKIKINKNPNCENCNNTYTPKDTTKIIQFCSTGRYQILGKTNFENLDWKKIDENTKQSGNITIFKNRTLIKANSKEEAESLYSKFVGN